MVTMAAVKNQILGQNNICVSKWETAKIYTPSIYRNLMYVDDDCLVKFSYLLRIHEVIL